MHFQSIVLTKFNGMEVRRYFPRNPTPFIQFTLDGFSFKSKAARRANPDRYTPDGSGVFSRKVTTANIIGAGVLKTPETERF